MVPPGMLRQSKRTNSPPVVSPVSMNRISSPVAGLLSSRNVVMCSTKKLRRIGRPKAGRAICATSTNVSRPRLREPLLVLWPLLLRRRRRLSGNYLLLQEHEGARPEVNPPKRMLGGALNAQHRVLGQDRLDERMAQVGNREHSPDLKSDRCELEHDRPRVMIDIRSSPTTLRLLSPDVNRHIGNRRAADQVPDPAHHVYGIGNLNDRVAARPQNPRQFRELGRRVGQVMQYPDERHQVHARVSELEVRSVHQPTFDSGVSWEDLLG